MKKLFGLASPASQALGTINHVLSYTLVQHSKEIFLSCTTGLHVLETLNNLLSNIGP